MRAVRADTSPEVRVEMRAALRVEMRAELIGAHFALRSPAVSVAGRIRPTHRLGDILIDVPTSYCG